MRITIWDWSRKVNHLSDVICDRKYNRVHQVDQFHQNKQASPYDGNENLQRQKY